MSELMVPQSGHGGSRCVLLTSVSMIAVLALIFSKETVSAAEGDSQPTVWIELGGQLERIAGQVDPFAPPFTRLSPTPEPYKPISPLAAQKPTNYSYGEEGKISFEPNGSDWVFSAGVRYGRSNNTKHVHQQSAATKQFPNPKYLIAPTVYPTPTATATAQRFADIKARNAESHLVLDFQAGKDVGLGFLNARGSSVVTAGVRFADFTSAAQATMIARPNDNFISYTIRFPGFPVFSVPYANHDDFFAKAASQISFQGVGPSVSWKASLPIAGRSDESEISFDWELNGAVLFGRQKAKGDNHVTARYYNEKYRQTVPPYGAVPLYTHSGSHNRSRAVVVPNVGGLVGVAGR